jgi:hypothetical protein
VRGSHGGETRLLRSSLCTSRFFWWASPGRRPAREINFINIGESKMMIQKKNLTVADQLIEAIEEEKTHKAKIEHLKKQCKEEKGDVFVQWALRADTKKAQTLKTLRKTGQGMTAVEICEYNGWSLLSRFYVWTILNYACYEGSPVKRVNIGRYQWVGA